MFTVHVRVVTPAPTYVKGVLVPTSGDPAGASPSQSPLPPGAFLSVTVTAAPGAALVALTARLGATTASVWATDVPPPGAGVNTVMLGFPTAAMSVARIAAVSSVADTNVVARAVPLTRTTEALVKFVPVAVSMKAAPPTPTLAGLTLVSVGTCGGACTPRFTIFEA